MIHSRVAFAAAAGWLAVVQIGLGNVVVAHGLDDCAVDIMPRLGVPQLGGAIPHRSASVPAHFPTITPLPRETVLLSQGPGPSASGTDAEPAKSVFAVLGVISACMGILVFAHSAVRRVRSWIMPSTPTPQTTVTLPVPVTARSSATVYNNWTPFCPVQRVRVRVSDSNPVVIPAHGFQGPVFISSGVRDRFLASYDAVQLARLYALPAGPSWSTEL
ncbi:hypothetical protein BKA62DRAFT_489198 [Auriculariales sp. MPI-PUGE-AT-0066]|nr:hypothetical protein BKA62DRAFT_489198 [Auriculariales sp. MPI-PUGE-AT-0066]